MPNYYVLVSVTSKLTYVLRAEVHFEINYTVVIQIIELVFYKRLTNMKKEKLASKICFHEKYNLAPDHGPSQPHPLLPCSTSSNPCIALAALVSYFSYQSKLKRCTCLMIA